MLFHSKKITYSALLWIPLVICSTIKSEEIKAVKTDKSPLIDGRLNDACWSKAQPVKNFTVNNTDKPSQLGTTAYIIYDDVAIYIGVICPEKDIGSIKKIDKLKRDSDDILRGDCIEIMIDPENSKNDYFHIGINTDGVIFDRMCTQGGFVGNKKWNGEFTAASFIGDKYWSCEISIPFYTLGITPRIGSKWGINICRGKQTPKEDSSIAKNGAFNVAGSFPELTGIEFDFAPYMLELDNIKLLTNFDSNCKMTVEVKGDIKNKTGKDKELLFECDMISPSQQTFINKKLALIKNNEIKNLTIDKIEVSEQGEYDCNIRLRDPVTKRTYFQKKTTLNINATIGINLSVPWYRNSIYETQNIKNIVFSVAPQMSGEILKDLTLTAGIYIIGEENPLITKDIKNIEKMNDFEFPVDKLPYGKLEIRVFMRNNKGKIVADGKCPINKLPHKNNEVWRGKDMNWYVDGKPFFLLGGWNYSQDFIPEYSVFSEERSDAKYIDTRLMGLVASKCKSIKTQERITEEEKNLIKEHVNLMKDKQALFAYYLSDEPECTNLNAKGLAEIYNLIADIDPYHPIIISSVGYSGLRDYALCSDINGLHPYPVSLNNNKHSDMLITITSIEETNKLFKNSYHKQNIAYMHQGFNYGDHGSVNNRIPNYKEYRDENLLALICGAQGILQYNRTVAHYPELYIGMPELTKELKYIGNIMLAPESKLTLKSSLKSIKKATKDLRGNIQEYSGESIKSMIKEFEGNVYIFICNAQMQETDIDISIQGLNKFAEKLNVISENRSIRLKDDSFNDKFSPYEVHIYTTSDKLPSLNSVKEICDKIDKANNARKKSGNLAFQMFEGEGVNVIVSSSAALKSANTRNIKTGLWHVLDGVTDTKIDYYKNLAWHDSTPDEFPDWIEIQLPKSENINKVVVYPFNKSLKDYSVQGFVNGEWKDLDKVSGKNDDVIEHKFDTVKTDKIRLWVTAANGKDSEVTEIEIYGLDKK